MKKLILVLAVFALSSCGTRPELTRRVLEDQGYTQIEITGWRPFQCGKDDNWSTGFRALSPAGKMVTGTVTTGIMRGSTIRLD